MADAAVCPECGAPRPRRAAGCPRCGHIFQDVPAAEPGLSAERVDAPRPSAPASHTQDEGARRGAGCGSCLLLAVICGGLTLIAGIVLWFLVRAELAPIANTWLVSEARENLQRLESELERFARSHQGRLPDALSELEVPAIWLLDPWGTAIAYEPAEDRRSARLVSLGADGAPGGEGGDTDLVRDVALP